ncbi:hypothetical protein WN59_02645 [Salinicoccus sediminis]|uniref:Lipoprotein n=1 Tax=Salinicoccus sediminis TaxID=1432562 RepID=A0A0M2SM24_9STAP|nr:hypothetical protein [Salinicoccus sediminis]KKK35734.1 hypothetical protein WN59_02645 [Salinicoccus sediminis]
MKRILLFAMLSAVLTACGSGGDSGQGENTREDAQNTSEETEEQGQTEESGEGQQPEADASEIIDQAIAEWGEASSYEARQTFTISSGNTQNVVRTITTQSEQNEVKVEVDNGSEVDAHYVIDGDHFTYEDGSINEEGAGVDMNGSTYGEIVQNLEGFKEGEATQTEEGYEIQLPVDSSEDVSGFVDQEVLDTLDGAESMNGQITVTLNGEYQYTGGKMTFTLEDEGSEINMISNLEYTRIGEIDVLEKPKNM